MTRREGGLVAALASSVAWSALAGVLLATASVVPFGGLGLIALAPLLGRATATPRAHGALTRPVAALLGAPALLAMPLLMASDPVVSSHWRCGTGMMAGLVLFPVLAFFVGAGGLGAAALAPRLLARVAPVLRATTLLGSCLLVLAAGIRAAWAPAPDDWAASLPIAARGEAIDADRIGQYEARVENPIGCALPPLRFTVPQAHRTIVARCETPLHLEVGDIAGHPLDELANPMHQIEVLPGAALEVRTHDRLGVAVLLQDGRVLGALDAETGRIVDVPLRMVAEEVAPRWTAVLAAAIGIAVAIRRARRASAERTAAARLAQAETARVEEDGLVVPDGGGASFRPPGGPLAVGPALILVRPVIGPFRAGPDRGTWVVPGDLASNVQAHRARAAAFDLEAAAAVAMASAPLVAAAMRGLVL